MIKDIIFKRKNIKTNRLSVNKRSIIREWIESIIVAFVLAMFIRTFFIQAFKIPTGSMEPTLLVGDHILVNKIIYGLRIPFSGKRIPLFGLNNKRLVAFGGERVKIQEGKIYINGIPLEDEIFNRFYYYNRGIYGSQEEITVPEGYYYVLGDNSLFSQDSRYWGVVPDRNILGKAFLIYWPPNRIRLIK